MLKLIGFDKRAVEQGYRLALLNVALIVFAALVERVFFFAPKPAIIVQVLNQTSSLLLPSLLVLITLAFLFSWIFVGRKMVTPSKRNAGVASVIGATPFFIVGALLFGQFIYYEYLFGQFEYMANAMAAVSLFFSCLMALAAVVSIAVVVRAARRRRTAG